MRTALFADIHGNREAFEACLASAQAQAVSRFIFLGDYVGYGADPCWVLEFVMEQASRGAAVILGNHDDAVLRPNNGMNDMARAAIDWTRAQLGDAHREFLKTLPMQFEEAGRLFVHASANVPSDWNYIANERSAARSFAATECRETFCGHIHVPQLYRETDDGEVAGGAAPGDTPFPLLRHWRWLAVVGSVGQPRDDNPDACYGLLDEERNELTYVRVRYDIGAAGRKIRAAGLPTVLASRLRVGR
jgi:diadenosine tetraphosphatase ApaH/serine/threonine PP2A family protein phosphatase